MAVQPEHAMTRALHIVAGKLYGGVETFLLTLARFSESCPALDQQFAVCFDGRLKHELTAAGATVHELGAVRVRNPLLIWKARNRLRNLIDENQIDVVICHMAWAQAIFGPAVRTAHKSLVFWMHDPATGSWLERLAGRTTPDLAICASAFTAATLPKLYPRASAEVIAYPLAPPPTFAPRDREAIRREFGTAADAIVSVQACRLEEWKGQRVHLQALAHLRDVPGWVCWIVGGAQRPHEEKLLNTLKSDALRFGIGDRVRFVGQRADVSRILFAGDIHCQPNIEQEPFGLSFIEAMHAQLPIVTS
ncbi:MAG TPA: glycosyltransferase, partial [Candidatus Acidoferrum sp.]|nr:glycosyltransferase [Candidatus Acidoferrum sp.]